MPNDLTPRGYLLPHPENIAVTDVVRIRESVIQIDQDVSLEEINHKQLKQKFERQQFERFIGLW